MKLKLRKLIVLGVLMRSGLALEFLSYPKCFFSSERLDGESTVLNHHKQKTQGRSSVWADLRIVVQSI